MLLAQKVTDKRAGIRRAEDESRGSFRTEGKCKGGGCGIGESLREFRELIKEEKDKMRWDCCYWLRKLRTSALAYAGLKMSPEGAGNGGGFEGV